MTRILSWMLITPTPQKSRHPIDGGFKRPFGNGMKGAPSRGVVAGRVQGWTSIPYSMTAQ
jgi:hypothetical protein